MMRFDAIGLATEDGQPVVSVTVTVPLHSADDIYKIIRKAGTQSVLAVGAWKERQDALEQANSQVVEAAAGK